AATLAVESIGGEDETTYQAAAIPLLVDGGSLLKKGRNVIAVEVHQSSSTSSDLGLDVGLAAGWAPDGYLDALSPGRWAEGRAAREGLVPAALEGNFRVALLLAVAQDPGKLAASADEAAWLLRSRYLRTRGPGSWEAALQAAEKALALGREARSGRVDARFLL